MVVVVVVVVVVVAVVVVVVAVAVAVVLWCCWLGGRKGIQPVKNLSGGVLAWFSVWGQVRFAYGPANATATHYLLLQ